jgi:hypothetical protein
MAMSLSVTRRVETLAGLPGFWAKSSLAGSRARMKRWRAAIVDRPVSLR